MLYQDRILFPKGCRACPTYRCSAKPQSHTADTLVRQLLCTAQKNEASVQVRAAFSSSKEVPSTDPLKT